MIKYCIISELDSAWGAFFARFLGGFTQKNLRVFWGRFFWVSTRASEPWWLRTKFQERRCWANCPCN